MKVLGINGIRSDGGDNTDLLLFDLKARGFAVKDVNYPKVSIFTARSRRRQHSNARRLVEAHQPGDAVIAHSYGCLLTLRAMEQGARFGDVFWFSPAMNTDFTIPYHGCERLFVIHTPNDRAIRLGELLWFHDFGAMGRVGYKGPPDERVTNKKARPKAKEFWRHSNYFHRLNRHKWVRYVSNHLRSKRHA